MDCDEIQRRVQAGEEPAGEAAAEHVRRCAACAAMLAAAQSLPRAVVGAAASAPGLASVLAAIEREDRPLASLRSGATPRRIAIGMAAVLAVPLLVVVATPRPDLAVYPAARLLAECAALAVVVALAAALTLRPMHRPARTGLGRIAELLAVFVAVALASLPAAHLDHPASLALDGADLVRRAAGCLVFGTLCGVPAWIALRLLARDGDRPGRRAGLIAAASAMVGIAGVFLHCPIVHHTHLWLGHVGVLALPCLWAIGCTFVGRRRGW